MDSALRRRQANSVKGDSIAKVKENNKSYGWSGSEDSSLQLQHNEERI